ncbi:YslB family protein [Bacillus coahuilensis]|uniref:YslB family protein n=1 Tax=Bacillus coahuilensis TaxID=408580 RepID=UPI000A4C2EB0|nr:YslB family protein [Bacillus coahuilensis]
MKKSSEANEHLHIESSSSFGYELIRDFIMPELLGKHTPELLYWMGKHVARKFPLATFEEVAEFFKEANWGELQIVEDRRSFKIYQLSGPIVERRLQMYSEPSFKLEAGFLAEQYQQHHSVLTECFEQIKKRSEQIHFTVQWDKHDTI